MPMENAYANEKLWESYQKILFYWDTDAIKAENFAIVTAWYPRSLMTSEPQNRQRQQQLLTDIEKLGVAYRTITVTADEGDPPHKEPSIAVKCDLPQAVELAKKYDQNAIFWVAQDTLSLVPVLLEEFPTTTIGSFRARVKD